MKTERLGRTSIKMCGMVREEDALSAASLGADFLGHIFALNSPRKTVPENARRVILAVRNSHPGVRHVGVFVDELLQTVIHVARECNLDFVQLHGNETPEYCAALREEGIGVIKVLRFGPDFETPEWDRYDVDFYLCDTYHSGMAGGTGAPFDHNLIPSDLPMDRCFVAGGLNPRNVAAVCELLHPFAVDVASGIETQPGVKDEKLMQEFMTAATSVQ